jgi:hypothetical protein
MKDDPTDGPQTTQTSTRTAAAGAPVLEPSSATAAPQKPMAAFERKGAKPTAIIHIEAGDSDNDGRADVTVDIEAFGLRLPRLMKEFNRGDVLAIGAEVFRAATKAARALGVPLPLPGLIGGVIDAVAGVGDLARPILDLDDDER